MVRKVIGSLGAILTDAQEQGLAAHNAVRDLRRNRRRGKARSAVAVGGRVRAGGRVVVAEHEAIIVLQGRPRLVSTVPLMTQSGRRGSTLVGFIFSIGRTRCLPRLHARY